MKHPTVADGDFSAVKKWGETFVLSVKFWTPECAGCPVFETKGDTNFCNYGKVQKKIVKGDINRKCNLRRKIDGGK
jgi:hypothetical protein